MSYRHYPRLISPVCATMASLEGFVGISSKKVSLNIEPVVFAAEFTFARSPIEI